MAKKAKKDRGVVAAKSWKDWLNSEEGKSCANDLPSHLFYLENRLWHAFMAGFKAGEV